jgi:protein-tyrosine phosphatase
MAEAVLREQLAKAGLDGKVTVDSAGTGDWHVGDSINPRAGAQLARHGYDGGSHRARQFQRDWLADRDLVLAMDAANFADLLGLADPDERPRIRLFGEIAGLGGQDVPDPYYGTETDYANVLALLEKGAATLIPALTALVGG